MEIKQFIYHYSDCSDFADRYTNVSVDIETGNIVLSNTSPTIRKVAHSLMLIVLILNVTTIISGYLPLCSISVLLAFLAYLILIVLLNFRDYAIICLLGNMYSMPKTDENATLSIEDKEEITQVTPVDNTQRRLDYEGKREQLNQAIEKTEKTADRKVYFDIRLPCGDKQQKPYIEDLLKQLEAMKGFLAGQERINHQSDSLLMDRMNDSFFDAMDTTLWLQNMALNQFIVCGRYNMSKEALEDIKKKLESSQACINDIRDMLVVTTRYLSHNEDENSMDEEAMRLYIEQLHHKLNQKHFSQEFWNFT